MKELLPIVLQYVVPALFGLVVGLALPWVRWWVEKRRKLFNYRQEHIKKWRSALESFDFDRHSLGDSGAYLSLQPHLRAEVRDAIEKPRTAGVPSEALGGNVKKRMLLDEVARLEKEWGLV
jgi:hypothetical protein